MEVAEGHWAGVKDGPIYSEGWAFVRGTRDSVVS